MIFRNLLILGFSSSILALAQTTPAPVAPPLQPAPPQDQGTMPNFSPSPVTGFNSSPVGGFSMQPFGGGFGTTIQAEPAFSAPTPATPSLVPPFTQNPVGGLDADPGNELPPAAPPLTPQTDVVPPPAPIEEPSVAPTTSAFTNAPGTGTTNLPPVVAPSPF